MNNLLKKITMFCVWFYAVTTYAVTNTDYSALSNNLAITPGIQAKTQG